MGTRINARFIFHLDAVRDGRIHVLGGRSLTGKFRPGDIRAERYSLHSHAEHGNEKRE
ncbi:MAG: hypothetical protein GY710_27025 [Desulfobacteraceae bacterium]|nr:hypothetical protein [Desulfobacteraceae bacterium]